MSELSATEKEHQKIKKSFRAVSVVALTVLGIGTVFYHFFNSLNWLDSLYYSVITLTTVGYGDIVPKTNLTKIFTIFYVIIGIGIIGTFANLLIQNASIRREIKNKKN